MSVFVRPEAENKAYKDASDFYLFRMVAFGVFAVVAIVAIIGGFAALAQLHQEKIDDSQLGAYYTDGPLEGRHFDRVMKPGSKAWVVNDKVYKLPARQITWIAGAGTEADADPLTFQTKDGAEMKVELSTRLFLNDDNATFRKFFTAVCQKFECWKGSTGGHVKDQTGWNRMLRETVGNPQAAVIRDIGLKYDSEELRYDTRVRAAFASQFADDFSAAQASQFGSSQFFCGDDPAGDCKPITVKVTNIQYTNNDLEHVREQRQVAERQEQLAVEQEKAAKAQQRVNAAKATTEYERLTKAQAMLKCAETQGCSLTFIVGNEGSVPVAVTSGKQ
jgi:hypothetical protein